MTGDFFTGFSRVLVGFSRVLVGDFVFFPVILLFLALLEGLLEFFFSFFPRFLSKSR